MRRFLLMNKLKFIMLCGLPGSGKTTYAERICANEKDFVHISSDKIRKELFGNEEDQEHNEQVFQEMFKRVKESFRNNKNVIYDACNINYKKRMDLLKRLDSYNLEKTCVVIYSEYDKCLHFNKSRERHVPEYVIKRMMENFYFPHKFEGWDNIVFESVGLTKRSIVDMIKLFVGDNGLCDEEHDNCYHSSTIGNHCLEAYQICCEMCADKNVRAASLLHDIGKPFVKSFKDRKGNESENAHYYQHQHVSAYFAAPYLVNNFVPHDLITILTIIQFHMMPYSWEINKNEKLKKKYIDLWGKELFEDIMIMHDADKQAH